jgi:hypothetical protein
MSLDQQLSVALAERADRLDAPMPDIGAVLAGGGRRQRRRVQRLVAAIAAVAVVVTAAAGLTWRGSRASGDPDQPAPEIARASDPVWCVTDPDRGEMIVGVGEPVKTPCRFGGEDWHVHLWHHAGTTLLTYRGLHRVDDGHLTYLAAGSEFVRMSHDGRYATWTPGCTTLEVYEVATGTRLAMTRTGATGCLHVEGIDDRGRVYMTVDHDEAVRDLDVRMYDVWASRWTRVVGLPEGAGRFGFLNYVTADGIAVPAEQYVVANSFSVGLSSIEGRVDSGGRFFGVQRVPVGRGLWSPDRTLVVEHRPEGVVVRPAAKLDASVLLDLLEDQFNGNHYVFPDLNLQWESPTSVLVTHLYPDATQPVYRCDANSGACDLVDHPGVLALGNNAQPGG